MNEPRMISECEASQQEVHLYWIEAPRASIRLWST